MRRVGFAFPGPFDYEHGVSLIRGVNKFERIYGLDISESLFPLLRRSGAEEFRYVNDASAFALGECLGGAACDAGAWWRSRSEQASGRVSYPTVNW